MSRWMIALAKVGVTYKFRHSLFSTGSFEALKDLSFSLKEGETLGVIGRNGAGKTTLLRLLAGIYKPDRGKVHIRRRLKISLLSLQLGFDHELSGRDNAILSGMLMGFSHGEIMRRLDAIIEFSELDEFISRPVKTYSSGMLARLGFSVALQMSPDVLLIDELLGVGDSGFQAKSTTAMRDKIRSNQTVVLVSHSGANIRNLCDRAVWIEQGTRRMVGDSNQVMDAYEEYIQACLQRGSDDLALEAYRDKLKTGSR